MNLEQYFAKLQKLAAQERHRKQAREREQADYIDDDDSRYRGNHQGNRE